MSRRDDHRNELPETLRELFTGPAGACAGEACLEDSQLAAWLDQTLGDTERTEALIHLSRCRACQARLVSLHEEIAQAWAADTPVPMVESRPEGRLVTWRENPPVNGNGAKPAQGHAECEKSKDGNGLDDEERKRRFVSGQS